MVPHRRYPLSPAMAAFVAQTQAFIGADDSLAGQRADYQAMYSAFSQPLPKGMQVVDARMGELGIRCHVPAGKPPPDGWPALLYLHGGGWYLGDLDSHAPLCAWLAKRTGALVVSVDYRLAPEYPFPAALEDCLAAWQALTENRLAVPVNPSRLAVGGDSAGGNLAVALCLRLRDQGQSLPLAQVLFYPALSARPLDSRRRHAQAPLLSSAQVQSCLNHYLKDPAQARNPLAMPLEAADLPGLPPAYIALAQFDPLRDDGALYARRLRQAGVAARLDRGRALVHGCMRALGRVPEVDRQCARLARWLALGLRPVVRGSPRGTR